MHKQPPPRRCRPLPSRLGFVMNILSIQSAVSYGHVGNSAAMFPLQRLGFETLINRSVVLTRNGHSVRATGLDDVHAFYTPAARAALGAKAEEFRIALVHSAEMADHAAAAGYALYLCGHTHGGQVSLPFIGPPIVPSRYAAGLFHLGKTRLYVNRGVGVIPPPVRFRVRPEISVFTLGVYLSAIIALTLTPRATALVRASVTIGSFIRNTVMLMDSFAWSIASTTGKKLSPGWTIRERFLTSLYPPLIDSSISDYRATRRRHSITA